MRPRSYRLSIRFRHILTRTDSNNILWAVAEFPEVAGSDMGLATLLLEGGPQATSAHVPALAIVLLA